MLYYLFWDFLFIFSRISFGILCITPLLLIRTKRSHINKMAKGLYFIIKKYENFNADQENYNRKNFHLQVERFYAQYVESNLSVQKIFPNIAVWIDYMAMMISLKTNHGAYINLTYLKALFLKLYTNKYFHALYEYMVYIIDLQNYIHSLHPYYKVTPYQQYLLKDICDLQQNNSAENTQSIIQKIESEFLRQEYYIKKNDKINKISIFVGVLGIAVSVVLALVNFK